MSLPIPLDLEPSMTSTSALYVESWLAGFDGHQFYTREWTAASPRAVVLYVHGFADHISRYDDIHARWPRRHITLFAYDMRGFGKTALDKKHRSPGASYGKTNRDPEIRDVDWWLRHLSTKYPDLPLFLMGYSAGGGLALAYATRPHPPPDPDIIGKLAGVIACGPLVLLSHPAPAISRLIAHAFVKIFPNKVISAPMPEERFSRRPEIVKGLKDDPLRQACGTIIGLMDMIGQGQELLDHGYRNWPEELPVLLLHGGADQVNDPKGGERFYSKLNATDKKLVTYPDAFHDLFHEIGDIPERTIDECLSWIEARIPSGAFPNTQ